MSILLTLLYAAAALAVLAEGLNKLERTDLSRRVLAASTWPEIAGAVLRAAGWLCMVLAAGGLLFAAQLPRVYAELGYALAVVGSACLVVRSRLEEFARPVRRVTFADGTVSDIIAEPFDRTQVLNAAHLRATLTAGRAMPDPNSERVERQLQDMQRRQGGGQ